MKKDFKNLTGLIIGCGSIGKRHLHNLKNLGIKDLSVFDKDEKLLDIVSKKYSVKKFNDLQTALSFKPNFSVICTFPNSHIQIANYCINSNSNIFIEKPISFDMKGISSMLNIAKSKNSNKAVMLNENIARNLGIGNSTGLGMAPFIVNHPTLLHNWIYCREKALKEIRSIENVYIDDFNLFKDCFDKSKSSINTWLTDSQFQINKIESLKSDLSKFTQYQESDCSTKINYLWNQIYIWVEKNLGEECIEYIVSMMMEPYDKIVDPLINNMSSEEEKYFNIPAHRKVSDLKIIIENNYKSIIEIDFKKKNSTANFWFISKNKEEPRVANRYEESGSELEQPLAIARDTKLLYEKVLKAKQTDTVAEFLLNNDDVRHVVRRAFIVEQFPYSEIQDNTISATLVPIDMLRLKLSFFGAVKFDPRSDKWLRINMYQGAPLPHEMKLSNDTWVYNSLH